jgi:hypothetical protein
MPPLREGVDQQEPSERIRGRRICGSLRAVEGFFLSPKKIGWGYRESLEMTFFSILPKIKDWEIFLKTLGDALKLKTKALFDTPMILITSRYGRALQ